jgi:hypothetical protein
VPSAGRPSAPKSACGGPGWPAERRAFIWDYDSWDVLTARQIELANDAGALTVLPLTLSTRAGVQLFAGALAEAASLVDRVEAVADATDSRTARYAAVTVAAFRGGEPDARDLIDANARDFASRGEGIGVTMTRWASAVLSNGLARYDEAFAAATEALEDPRELWFSVRRPTGRPQPGTTASRRAMTDLEPRSGGTRNHAAGHEVQSFDRSQSSHPGVIMVASPRSTAEG